MGLEEVNDLRMTIEILMCRIEDLEKKNEQRKELFKLLYKYFGVEVPNDE